MKRFLTLVAVTSAISGSAFAAETVTPEALGAVPAACGTTMQPRAATGNRPAQTDEQRAARAAQAANPDRWESSIAKFEAQDKTNPPAPGGIVFVGSSSIVYWNLPGCFPQLGAQAVNRGFGGSLIGDSARYVDRIVIPYKPRLVVLYAGDNDLTNQNPVTSAEQIYDRFTQFEKKVHAALPSTRVMFVSIKPSILRFSEVEKAMKANEMIRAYCAKTPNSEFLDITPLMLGEDGKPRPELLVQDGLHMTSEGYKLWTAAIAPLLK